MLGLELGCISMEGAALTEGAALMEGCELGMMLRLGSALGKPVGSFDGTKLGAMEGTKLGFSLALGTMEGRSLHSRGDQVGRNDGAAEGRWVGLRDGLEEGMLDKEGILETDGAKDGKVAFVALF